MAIDFDRAVAELEATHPWDDPGPRITADQLAPIVPAGQGPMVRRREKWLEIPAEEYAGFSFRVWVNHPTQLMMDLLTPGQRNADAALNQIVLEHNGWRDEEGRPYPPAGTQEFLTAIPNELLACVIRVVQLETQRLPNSLSLAPKR